MAQDRPYRHDRPYRRMITAALVTLAALAVFGAIGLQAFLRYEFDLVTYVDDAAGIGPASPVMLHGISIGHVRRVVLSGSTDPNRTVRIDMRFSRSYLPQIPEDSTIAITAANLLGDKFLDISRGLHSSPIAPGAEIRSTQTQDIGSVLNRASVPLKEVDDILARIDRIVRSVNENDGTAGLLINDKTMQKGMEGITAGVKQIETDVKNGQGAALHIADIETDAKKPLARFNEIMADLDRGKGSLGRFMHDPYDPTLTAEVTATMNEARGLLDDFTKTNRPADLIKQAQTTSDKAAALLDRIDAGQGTLGQFLVNPQLRDSLKRATTELNSLTTAIGQHPTRFVQLRFGLF